MDWIKIILAALGLFLLLGIVFWLVGVVAAILWYVFWIAVVGAIGYAGYKYLKKEGATPQIAEKPPIAISEMQNVDRELEEYKRKYLPK